MEGSVGIVCGACDSWNAVGNPRCSACAHPLTLVSSDPRATRQLAERAADERLPRPREPVDADELASLSAVLGSTLRPRRQSSPQQQKLSATASGTSRAVSESGHRVSALESARLSLEELMEQAKNYVCRSCSTPVPLGHKFCGRCGAAVPPDILATRTQFFGQLQQPGKAKLILIRGEGVEGLSYQLNANEHVVGRQGQLVFPDDPFVSPRHANLFYRDQKLVVRDEGSLNGVYVRLRGSAVLQPGEVFMAGEQLFRAEGPPPATDEPGADDTHFYSSPKHQTSLRVVQLLHGGAEGMAVCARAGGLQIGREGGDLNFPSDLYMSASHCKIEMTDAGLELTDLGSRNGTYVRIASERELSHGDYLFIGKKLLRVEITAA